jgi:hypothetical protein
LRIGARKREIILVLEAIFEDFFAIYSLKQWVYPAIKAIIPQYNRVFLGIAEARLLIGS